MAGVCHDLCRSILSHVESVVFGSLLDLQRFGFVPQLGVNVAELPQFISKHTIA